jgi:hypothetical protein
LASASGSGSAIRDFAGRLLVVVASFDCGEFGGLVVVHVIAGQVTEKELRRHEHRREVEAHAQHDARFCRKHAAQQIPCPGRGDAEGAGKV